eukprot:scaffold8150_cov116-Isochrysis_galbana.AAC.3
MRPRASIGEVRMRESARHVHCADGLQMADCTSTRTVGGRWVQERCSGCVLFRHWGDVTCSSTSSGVTSSNAPSTSIRAAPKPCRAPSRGEASPLTSRRTA